MPTSKETLDSEPADTVEHVYELVGICFLFDKGNIKIYNIN